MGQVTPAGLLNPDVAPHNIGGDRHTGTLADSMVQESNVTQHQDAIRRPIEATVDWDPGSGVSTVSSGPLDVFELPKNADRSVVGDYFTPTGVELTTTDPVLQTSFVVTGLGAGSADVRLKLELVYMSAGDVTTKPVSQTLSLTVPVTNTADHVHTITFTLDRTLMAAGQIIALTLTRLTGDAADTFTGKIGIIEHSNISLVR